MSLEIPFLAVIPYEVQIDKNLSDAAKIYFGQIVGLSKKYGYIFATDDALAEMKGVPKRSIVRWNSELEKAGHIRKEVTNEKVLINDKKNPGKKIVAWVPHRRIYVVDAFQKNSPIEPKMAIRSSPADMAKNGALYINRRNKEHEQQQRKATPSKPSASAAAKASQYSEKTTTLLQERGVPNHEFTKWKCSELEVIQALKLTKNRENPLRSLRAAIRDGWAKLETEKLTKKQTLKYVQEQLAKRKIYVSLDEKFIEFPLGEKINLNLSCEEIISNAKNIAKKYIIS